MLVGLIQLGEGGNVLDDAVFVDPVLHAVVTAPGEEVGNGADEYFAWNGQESDGRVGAVVNLDEGAGGVCLCADDVLLIGKREQPDIAVVLIGDGASSIFDGEGCVVAFALMYGYFLRAVHLVVFDEQVASCEQEQEG